MTPKEKAQELLIRMWSNSSDKLAAKQSTLIVVDEVVKQYAETYNKWKQLPSNVFVLDCHETEKYKFWQEVKREITNL